MNIFEGLQLSRLNPKYYLSDIAYASFSFIITTIIVATVYTWHWLPTSVYTFFSFSPIPTSWLRVILWMILFLCSKWFVNSFRHGTEYFFSPDHWDKRWLSSGNNHVSENSDGLVLEHSGSGCLLQDTTWKNFEMCFTMGYAPPIEGSDQSMGILFRAINLDTGCMIEFHIDKDNKNFRIKPHLRLNGVWEPVDDRIVGSVTDYKQSIHVILTVKERIVTVKINGSQLYKWNIPTNFGNYTRQEGDMYQQPQDAKSAPKMPYIHSYGMIGFRANWGQGATITGLSVKTLSWWDMYFLKNRRIF